MSNTAIIIGATGAVGKEILKETLKSDFYTKVYVLGRSSINNIEDNEKLEKIVVDFEDLNIPVEILDNADIFAALGTTIKIAKTKENQRKIDLDYTLNFAKLCENRVRSFNVVSAVGANKDTNSFYLSLKGKLEDGLGKMNLGALRIYRPSLLIAEREDKRLLEEIFMKAAPFFKKILRGSLKKYSPIETSFLGEVMVTFAINNKSKGIYTYKELFE